MKVSGFTFCRNAVRYDYPVVESIQSILPIVDEFIVNVGRCADGTRELIRSIGDPKIRIVESVWDETLRKDGLIYSQQTNIALASCTGEWARLSLRMGQGSEDHAGQETGDDHGLSR